MLTIRPSASAGGGVRDNHAKIRQQSCSETVAVCSSVCAHGHVVLSSRPLCFGSQTRGERQPLAFVTASTATRRTPKPSVRLQALSAPLMRERLWAAARTSRTRAPSSLARTWRLRIQCWTAGDDVGAADWMSREREGDVAPDAGGIAKLSLKPLAGSIGRRTSGRSHLGDGLGRWFPGVVNNVLDQSRSTE